MRLLSFAVFLFWLLPLHGQPSDDIKSVLTRQADAWNRADIPGFVATYAEHCTLVGAGISHVSRADVLAHYREKYPTSAAMGHLIFSELKISMLDDRHATAVGHWHLDRTATAGGPAGGVFSLFFERQNGAWLIILDHTS